MLDFCFLFLLRMLRMLLISFTVTCGHLLYSACLAIDIIWSLLMIFSHYSWTFPLRPKSETFPTLLHFFAWVSTQFGLTVKAVQCDNGRKFNNSTSRSFFLSLSGCSVVYVLSVYLSSEQQG